MTTMLSAPPTGRQTRAAGLTALVFLLAALMPETVLSRPPDGHGGDLVNGHRFADHMSAQARLAIEKELEAAAARLTAEGRLPPPRGALTPSSLAWPLRARPGFEFDDYHGVSNFVDLDPNFPNQLLDYMCGARTYDLQSGYNHAGIDYFLWPYPWRMMDQEMIEIVAVAPGTILAKHDGNDDRNCTLAGGQWNAVYIQHADGSVAWYGHMVNGSPTAKNVGDSVVQGEYLGLVGSSGNSTGPHLHLELRSSSSAGADIYEPHEGECNDTVDDSLWQQQRAYFDTALNGVGVHHAQPSMAVSCPNPGQEQANLTSTVGFGDPVWFSIYMRDTVPGQPDVTLRLYRPDGGIYHEWQFNYGESGHFSAAWWWWTWSSLGKHESYYGEWRFEARFDGQIVSRTFHHGEPGNIFTDRFEQ